MFLIVVLSNFLFLIYWFYKWYGEVKNIIRKNYGKLYLCLCLCGNEKKFNKEIKVREKQDENDVLKERFEEAIENVCKLVKQQEFELNEENIGKFENQEIWGLENCLFAYLNIHSGKTERYLAPKIFLANWKKKVEEEIFTIEQYKRQERKLKGELMHRNLQTLQNKHSESQKSFHIDSYGNISHTKDKLEDGLHEFLGISPQLNKNNLQHPHRRSCVDDSENRGIDYMKTKHTLQNISEQEVCGYINFILHLLFQSSLILLYSYNFFLKIVYSESKLHLLERRLTKEKSWAKND